MATVFYESSNELATLTNTFKVAGVPTDPTTISLTITSPSGVVATYTFAAAQITRTGTGVYTKDIACNEDGLWTFEWVGTGAATDTEVGTWTVFHTEMWKLYSSVEELKSRLMITTTTNDFELRKAIEAASRYIDEECDRYFWRGTATRTYECLSNYVIEVDDLVSVTTLKTDAAGDGTFETVWATTDYQLHPVNRGAITETYPYTTIRAVGAKTFPVAYSATTSRLDRCEIVGVFGWPAVPSAIKEATMIVAADLFRMKDAPFGVMGFGEFGLRVRDNSRARALLNPYRKKPYLVA